MNTLYTIKNGQSSVVGLTFDDIYPVGSIYMSVVNTNPGNLFGGTWVAWGSGRVPVGVDTNDSNFDTVEKSVGGNTTSYTPQGSNTAVTLTADQSGIRSHNHGLNNHTHSIPALSGSTNKTGAHNHDPWDTNSRFICDYAGPTGITLGNGGATIAGQVAEWDTTYNAGDHTHTVTTNASTTGGNTGNTANNGAANATKSHNHTFTGTEANISTIQKSITCYMWKRTA